VLKIRKVQEQGQEQVQKSIFYWNMHLNANSTMFKSVSFVLQSSRFIRVPIKTNLLSLLYHLSKKCKHH